MEFKAGAIQWKYQVFFLGAFTVRSSGTHSHLYHNSSPISLPYMVSSGQEITVKMSPL
jgi:hypothetical protein